MPNNHIGLTVQTTMTSFDCILIKSVPVAFDYLRSEVRCHTRELCQQHIYPLRNRDRFIFMVLARAWNEAMCRYQGIVEPVYWHQNIRRINVQLVERFSLNTACFAHPYTCISNKFSFSLPSFERNVFTVDYLKYMYFIFKICHNCIYIFIMCAILVESMKWSIHY